jgi:hypothetical protein
MMPPPEVPRPDEATLQALAETLEATVDALPFEIPIPGIVLPGGSIDLSTSAIRDSWRST